MSPAPGCCGAVWLTVVWGVTGAEVVNVIDPTSFSLHVQRGATTKIQILNTSRLPQSFPLPKALQPAPPPSKGLRMEFQRAGDGDEAYRWKALCGKDVGSSEVSPLGWARDLPKMLPWQSWEDLRGAEEGYNRLLLLGKEPAPSTRSVALEGKGQSGLNPVTAGRRLQVSVCGSGTPSLLKTSVPYADMGGLSPGSSTSDPASC